MDATKRLVEGAVAGSPFAKKLGIVCESIEPDRVRMRLPYSTEVTTMGDLVHGGAISALVDTTATAAAWSVPEIGPGARGTTIGFSINFLAGGRGQDLIATASAIQRGKSICVVEVDVRDAAGTPVARATVTYKLSTAPEKPAAQPPAVAMASLFEGKPVAEQKAILASLERAGAALYRALAANEPDASVRATLEDAAKREEENARVLEGPARGR